MPLDPNIILSEWTESAGRLPGQADFDPFGGCIDALSAWDDFGGLTRSEGFEKFCSSPDSYHEGFMWMGGRAFAFYFPIIERYVFQTHIADDEDEVDAIWILAHCISLHLDPDSHDDIKTVRDRILTLTQHVRSNLSKFGKTPTDQRHVDEAWRELHQCLERSD
jgi:hypothetical protein